MDPDRDGLRRPGEDRREEDASDRSGKQGWLAKADDPVGEEVGLESRIPNSWNYSSSVSILAPLKDRTHGSLYPGTDNPGMSLETTSRLYFSINSLTLHISASFQDELSRGAHLLVVANPRDLAGASSFELDPAESVDPVAALGIGKAAGSSRSLTTTETLCGSPSCHERQYSPLEQQNQNSPRP